MPDWKIIYYQNPQGKHPVKEFIDKLSINSQTKVYHTLELLAEFGIKLGLPHSRKITNTPLWELRIFGQQSLRIFYIALVGQRFMLLHGFTKKKQKTPQKELKIALKRFKDIKS